MVFRPLIVDLDGTLIHTDMLHESVLNVVTPSPIKVLRILFWLSKGKSVLKARLASQAIIDLKTLPYNFELLDWLKQKKSEGRKLILCTASDKSIAVLIAQYLGIFDEVLGSDTLTNLTCKQKAETILQRFGHFWFDYVGNSKADLAVWKHSHRATIVNASMNLEKKAKTLCEVDRVFHKQVPALVAWRGVFRVHQWLKNLLLFVPIFAAHDLTNRDIWVSLALAFISFSCCASAVYIINDLLDLQSDRLHPRKRNRPFAVGAIPVWKGVLLAPVLVIMSMGVGFCVGESFQSWLIFYFLLTCAYSWTLKRLMIVDCLSLAMLYTLRIVAGAAAAGIGLSFWLLTFSVFLFLSLAFVKRYAELEVQLLMGREKVHGRGYYTSDAPLIQTLGIASGYASILVLALYLNSDTVVRLYRAPELLWGAVPIILFWISWIWMQAHRGKMHDDPLVFALSDTCSLVAGIAFVSVLVVSAVGWPW
ncbi:MAG: UbiA family prenyltransferase [Methylococcales bacterium]